LFIALLFAGFAVTANGGIAIGEELARNKWQIATRLDANNVDCVGGKVEVRGKLKVDFEKRKTDGKVVPITVEQNGQKFLPKDASNGVGADALALRPNRTFKVDKVEVEFGRVGVTLGTMTIRIFFVSKPNAVNTAQGDVSPGKTFTFTAVYKKVDWSWNDNDKVKSLTYSDSFAKCP